MIKTLHITNAFHASSGGVATSYRALLREANKTRRPMRLVVPSDRDEVEEIGQFGRIYYVSAPQSRVFDRRYRIILPHRYLLGRSGRIWEILRAEQPDLLEVRDKFCLNWLGGLFRKGWHRKIKRPVLVGSSSERMEDSLSAYVASGRVSSSFARLYIRYCYLPLFDFHLANSPYTASELYEAMTEKHARPIFVCPEGVDCESLTPTLRDPSVRAALLGRVGGSSHSTLLLYSGRLSPEKNVMLLADVMRELGANDNRDYRLIIAGEGPLAAALEHRLRAVAPGRFAFFGHLRDRAELARLYANCDVFIHPNPREPFGMAPLEAMASGLALVAPDSGGILSFANKQNSWSVPADASSFARAIRDAADPHERKPKTERALVVARQHDWPNVASRLFGLFDRLVESRRQPALASESVGSLSYG